MSQTEHFRCQFHLTPPTGWMNVNIKEPTMYFFNMHRIIRLMITSHGDITFPLTVCTGALSEPLFSPTAAMTGMVLFQEMH